MTWTAFIALGRQYWPKISIVILVFLCYLYAKQSGELKACKSAMEAVKLEVKQNQDMGGKLAAKTGLQGKITLPKCPPAALDGQGKCPPCEGAVIDFTGIADAYAEGKASQAQSVTVTPTVLPNKERRWFVAANFEPVKSSLSLGLVYDFRILQAGLMHPVPIKSEQVENFNGFSPLIFLSTPLPF